MAIPSTLGAFRSSRLLAFVLLGGAGAARSINVVFVMPYLQMVRVCCSTLTMPNGPFVVCINLFYVCLSVVFALFKLPVSDGLSTNTNSLALRTGVPCTPFSYS